VLLTGAALAAAGMLELTKLKLGYQPKGVLTMFVFAPASHYPQWSQRRAFFTDIIERLRKIPGAESVAATLTGAPPYSGAPSKFDIDGLPSTETKIRVNLVSDTYFSTIGIPLLKGRYFDAEDVSRVNPVAVVTEDLVKKYFPPGQDPMGRQISLDLFTGPQPPNFTKSPQNPHVFQIVGICGTTRNSGLRDAPEPAVYLPFSAIFPPGMMFAIRTSKPDPLALSNGARQAVSAVDPTQPIAFVHPLDYFLNNATAYPRFATFLFGVFGAIGLTLACTGIFSVVSYAVSRRTREFGIRMALGATPRSVLGLVMRSTGRVLVVGFALGAISSVVSSRALAGKLEGIGVASPLMLAAITSVLALAAFFACAIPARSATNVQPVDALRHE
jgi:predicted permease